MPGTWQELNKCLPLLLLSFVPSLLPTECPALWYTLSICGEQKLDTKRKQGYIEIGALRKRQNSMVACNKGTQLRWRGWMAVRPLWGSGSWAENTGKCRGWGFQTKGVAGTNALQVGAKSISRAEISQVKLKGKDNHKAFDLTIELGRISEIKCNQLPQFIDFIDKPRTLVLLMLH